MSRARELSDVAALSNAKGDLVATNASLVFDRLPVGTADQVLVADPAQNVGVKWQTPVITGEPDQIVLATQVFG